MRHLIVLVLLPLAACVPWTVRPIESESKAPRGTFDPVTYARDAWTGKLRPALEKSAVDVSDLLREGAPRTGALAVKGAGTIERVDTSSRAGKLTVAVPGGTAELQIGPVLRGTTIRDGSGFISFNDFQSQIEYAAAANALNAHVLNEVITPVRSALARGRRVEFLGTLAAADISNGAAKGIVPVRLEVR